MNRPGDEGGSWVKFLKEGFPVQIRHFGSLEGILLNRYRDFSTPPGFDTMKRLGRKGEWFGWNPNTKNMMGILESHDSSG